MPTPVSSLYQNAESHSIGRTKFAVCNLQSHLQKSVKKLSGLAGIERVEETGEKVLHMDI